MPKNEFVVDKITNSIEERISGKSFKTTVQFATEDDIKSVLKKNGWRFNWKQENKQPNRQIFKLLIEGTAEIQGLVSLEVMKIDQYVEMHLIESAPHNYGSGKHFLGVAGNLVAFACKMSFEMGFDGFVGFTAKTRLVQHYIDSLGARVLTGNNRMGLFTQQAKKLVNSYYKNLLDD